jgi:hypothetical protein
MAGNAKSRTRRRLIVLLCVAFALAGLTVAMIRLTSRNRDPRLIGRWGFQESGTNSGHQRKLSLDKNGRTSMFPFAIARDRTGLLADQLDWRVSGDELILEPAFVPAGDIFGTLTQRVGYLFQKITGRWASYRFEIVQIHSDQMQLRPIDVPMGRIDLITKYDRLPD